MPPIPYISLTESFKLHQHHKLIGLYKMAEVDYRAPPGLNQSALKYMIKCPLQFKTETEKEDRNCGTKAMDMGHLIHTLLLEGEEVFKSIAVSAPVGMDARTKDFKQFKEMNKDKIVLTRKDWAIVDGIKRSAEKDDIVQRCLSGGHAEVCCFGYDKHGILLKGKVDYFKEDVIFDLKTCRNAEEHPFAQSSRKYRYDIQAAFYLDVMNLAVGKDNQYKRYGILAVEKFSPYLFNYFAFSDVDIDAARCEYESLIKAYIICRDKDEWPGFSKRFKIISTGSH